MLTENSSSEIDEANKLLFEKAKVGLLGFPIYVKHKLLSRCFKSSYKDERDENVFSMYRMIRAQMEQKKFR